VTGQPSSGREPSDPTRRGRAENTDPHTAPETKRPGLMSPIAREPARSYDLPGEPAAVEPVRPGREPATPVAAWPVGRVPVVKVSPVIEGGAYPAKAAVGELITIAATVFREGHDAVNATAVLTAPSGAEHRVAMHPCEPAGFNRMDCRFAPEEEGLWRYRVEGWDDPWATWLHHAEIKIPAGIDLALVCTDGEQLLAEGADQATAAHDRDAATTLAAAVAAMGSGQQAISRLAGATTPAVRQAMARYGPRRLVSPSAEFPIFCDRRAALFSSWYEFFPRSQGASYDAATDTWTSGTFDSSHERLRAAAAMGFDVIYLPPIHPIGTTFRKGPNNTLDPDPSDPGSPWAIGGPDGGHDTIHPDLGDWEAFDRFVAKTESLGMEVALDFALQASPDHPWVTDHPEWFSTRVDGSIAYAENPPKKYQDIYPINFDRSPATIYAECLRIVKVWMSHGVRIFRVDNPHTKPVDFWAWLLAEVRRTDPDVLFLAEAFTRPEMMHTLGKVGYHQSYTYFTWRNEKWEIEQYLTELSTQTDAFVRPNFFVNTPDILPAFLQHGGPTAFTIRAVLAATLSPTWGVYSGFELFESQAVRPGSEEYLDSEKYQYRPRDWSASRPEGDLCLLLGRLNEIRREHPALQQLRDITFHHAPDAEVIVYSKTDHPVRVEVGGQRLDPAEQAEPTALGDTVIVVCSLDPHTIRETEIRLDLAALGVADGEVFEVRDQLTGQRWRWGMRNFVRLTPSDPAHVLSVHRIGAADAA